MKRDLSVPKLFTWLSILACLTQESFAAQTQTAISKSMSMWELIVAGGSCMIFLGIISIAGLALTIYHFLHVRAEKLTPRDFSENLLSLLGRREYEKARAICRQQDNLISAITLPGLEKIYKGHTVVEEAIQYEGKARIEKLWQTLSYLGDMAVIAPMLGLLGTILGMIDAFSYQSFKAGIIQPVSLAQGLAKAMITTAFGLIIAVPILIIYSYFRGRVTTITSNAERLCGEIVQSVREGQKDLKEKGAK